MIVQSKNSYFRRGTTPSVTFHLKDDFPLDSVKNLFITLVNGNTVIEFQKEDTVIDLDEHTIVIKLEQENTLLLNHNYPINMQIRFLMNDGSAPATGIKTYKVEDVLKDGVIE